ncbi:MAG TPA: peptide chain release factor N(5)-glutamine methyltransferase [Gaiellaceae bacterium]|nr:peptide chain release factor N(5)-glutamine methyltransferase [Gaiellaceae bacterium]
MTALEAVRSVAGGLDAAGVPSPRIDAECLVASVLGVSRAGLYAAGRELTEDELQGVLALRERRRAREPLAYVLGEWGFRRLTLRVDRRALVPRPETEVLVERCLAHLAGLAAPSVVDVGVGSGAVALAIADEHPGARVLGIDSSAAALALARENLERLDGDGRVRLRRGDLLRGLSGPFDLVVSNPPYVSPDEYERLQPEIRLWEPYEALVGERVGETIARQALPLLRPGGPLVLECGDGQAAALAAELRSLGYEDVLVTPDLAGRERIVEGRRP